MIAVGGSAGPLVNPIAVGRDLSGPARVKVAREGTRRSRPTSRQASVAGDTTSAQCFRLGPTKPTERRPETPVPPSRHPALVKREPESSASHLASAKLPAQRDEAAWRRPATVQSSERGTLV